MLADHTAPASAITLASAGWAGQRTTASRRLSFAFGAMLASVLAFAPATLPAQAPGTGTVTGTVADSGGRPIAGAEVTVVETTIGHRTFTDARGAFNFPGVQAGPATVQVRRLGYRPATVPITVVEDDTLSVPLSITQIVQDLAPVVIEAGRRNYTGRLADFYMRRDRGSGHFYTHDDIVRRNPARLSDLFRTIPGVRIGRDRSGQNVVQMRGRQCTPLVWLDGMPATAGYLDPDSFDPRSFDGIEIYMGTATVPAQLMWTRGLGSCGVIALWTRLPEPRPRNRGNISAEELANLVTSLKVYTAEQVDFAVVPDSLERANPAYPDSLRRNKIGGRVLAEFVVDTTGLVETNTIGVVSSTHPLLSDAVRTALRRAEYHPATLNGRLVRQVVQQPFLFVPPGASTNAIASP